MIQKKVCMVGLSATGKTSLVHRLVYSIFSVKYHSTVGVKVDRAELQVGDTPMTLVLWDLEGRTPEQEVPSSYLRGAHGILYVSDGTRRETLEELESLRNLATAAAGPVPSVVALNKADLADSWQLRKKDYAALKKRGLESVRTSAKSGEGVEDAFAMLAKAMLAGNGSVR